MEFKTKGNQLFSKKKPLEAIAAYTAGIDLIESGEDQGKVVTEEDRGCLHLLFSNRSTLQLGQCLVDEALQDAECAIEANGEFGKAYARRAAVLIDLFQFKAALEDLDKAEELDPSLVESLKENRLRATGKKWIPNCYLRKQIELQQKHKCHYVLLGEFEGESYEEPVRITKGTIPEHFFKEAWKGAVAGKGTTEELASSLLPATSNDGNNVGDLGKKIRASVPPSSTDEEGKENNVERVGRDEHAVLEKLLKEQLRREFGPDAILDPSMPKPTAPQDRDYFVFQAVGALVNAGGMREQMDHNVAILLPSAPKWCLPDMVEKFNVAAAQQMCQEGEMNLQFALQMQTPIVKEAAKALRKYRKRFEGRESKCHGCGNKINDPDPQECLCGEMYCSFPCHKRNWPTHKAACRREILAGKIIDTKGVNFTTMYWLCVSQGYLPCKQEPDLVSLWKERGITAENHEDPLEAELKFHYENERNALMSELCLVDKGANDEQRHFVKVEVMGKWMHKMTTPLHCDSIPRLSAKIRICRILAPMGKQQGNVPYPEDMPGLVQSFAMFAHTFKKNEPGATKFIADMQALVRTVGRESW